jgi:predicted ribosomally synthesized peptide with SipW-like signal peptide
MGVAAVSPRQIRLVLGAVAAVAASLAIAGTYASWSSTKSTTGSLSVASSFLPVFTPNSLPDLPTSGVTYATSSSGATVSFTPPTAADAHGSGLTVTCNHHSGDTFPIGSTTTTCSATAPGNWTDSRSFAVSVNPHAIVTPAGPISLNHLSPSTVTLDGSGSVVDGSATYQWTCSATGLISCTTVMAAATGATTNTLGVPSTVLVATGSLSLTLTITDHSKTDTQTVVVNLT